MTALLPAGEASAASPAGGPVLGVDVLSGTLAEADSTACQLVAALRAANGLEGAEVLTHLTRLGPRPHLTLSVRAPALAPEGLEALVAQALPEAVLSSTAEQEDDEAAAARAGAGAHARGESGRAVHFAGVEHLVGSLPVADVLDRSAIAAVHVLGGTGAADPATALTTRGHVRPSYEQGVLVLAAEWAVGRTLVPFETPRPTPCCVDHP